MPRPGGGASNPPVPSIRASPAVSGTFRDHLFSTAVLDMPSRESAVHVTSPIQLSDTWHTGERHYTRTPFPSQPGDAPSKFIKRQLHRHEMITRYDGEPGLGYYNLDRLQNERDAMTFVAHNTSIPVPRVLEWSVDDDGTASLTMETVEGRTLEELLEGDDLTEEEKALLMRNVESFMDDIVSPQLATLGSATMGQLAGVLFFPPRCDRTHMPSHPNGALAEPAKQASAERYTFCHNDLARGNIVIHSDSFEVKYILDWEYAGFFPPGFEFPYWRYSLQDYCEWDNDPSGTMMASRRALLAREANLSGTNPAILDTSISISTAAWSKSCTPKRPASASVTPHYQEDPI
ncbi:MAG: hypothetical protein Q9204_000608 [Flavoplaca sp. TL-2023a]